MLAWVFTFLFFFLGMKWIFLEFLSLKGSFGLSWQRTLLQRVVFVLGELEETLMAGLVPSSDRWKALQTLQEPWRSLASESLKELRDSGGALIPTLKRLRSLASEHQASLEDARSKSSQAFAQALVCLGMVPCVGGSFYFFVPGVQESLMIWGVACLGAFLFSSGGAYWLISLSAIARWGGLKGDARKWILASQCAGEKFLALVRIGNPADLAWIKTIEFLRKEAPGLSKFWGNSIWESSLKEFRFASSEGLIVELGVSIRKSIQVSLMEGRPCIERVENLLLGLRQDMRSQIERELALLPTRALKPLFICVAPSLMGLVCFGLWLATMDSLGE